MLHSAAPKTHDDYLADGHTPMMAQYHSIKAAHPDCLLFYRMGDFYEMFYEDAEVAAAILDITLTKRGKSDGTDIPMCGVPFHSCDPYLERLIKAGQKVAIAEQTETPDQAKARVKAEGKPASKALVNREVVRVVTQGTLTEDTLLPARENNYLASIVEMNREYGMAWMDLSTGAFFMRDVAANDVSGALQNIDAREILMAEQSDVVIDGEPIITRQPSSLFNSENAHKKLTAQYGVNTLESFGAFSRAEIAAAGSLLNYVERTQKGHMPYLQAPRKMAVSANMAIDGATRRNLELVRTTGGDRKGSLLDAVDHTVTAGGARLLHEHLSAPLSDIEGINKRLSIVSYFVGESRMRDVLREAFKGVPDFERALNRVHLGRCGPRDLVMVRNGLSQIQKIRMVLHSDEGAKDALSGFLKALHEVPEMANLADMLNKALSDDVPFLARDGGFVRGGYHHKLDQLKLLRDESKKLIAGLQGEYKKISSVDTLKIKHNKVLGYFIEVTPKHADGMMALAQNPESGSPFIHRQTLANAVRFTTAQLAELERDISSAGEKSLALELEIFGELCEAIKECSDTISLYARSVAALDVAASHAHLAVDQNYCAPVLSEGFEFDITEGRHPVVEQALRKGGEAFVPNGCHFDRESRIWLLTGPNMAGKSTYLRQNALIAILAQIGCYVPATAANIGVVDRVFSRVGASDDLARGRSTFMVEMVETAAILNQATERSLVILDEIGRGTATFDGLSIAWACVEHLHDANKARALFATHYHELTSLTQTLSALSCHSMQVKEWKGDIVFLHSVGAGAANQSYGIHVGNLAGLPPAVIARAKDVLAHVQSAEHAGRISGLVDELPLFSNAMSMAEEEVQPPALTKLSEVEPDEMSPKEALEVLYALKELVE